MRATFSPHETYQVAHAEIQPTEVRGIGGGTAPELLIPVRLEFHRHTEDPRIGLRFGRLSGRIDLDGQPFAFAREVEVNELLRHGSTIPVKVSKTLFFPLDVARLEHLERARRAGEMSLGIHLELVIEKLFVVGPSPHQNYPVWGLIHQLDVQLDSILSVPHSSWLANVLPGVGYGIVHLVEMPVIPLAAIENYRNAHKALQNAKYYHRQGLYDEAVGECRVAMEKFFDQKEVPSGKGGTRFVPVLKASWETKIGKATYDWLSASFLAIKGEANVPHHSPDDKYDQLESQILIAVTVSLIAYAAKRALPPN